MDFKRAFAVLRRVYGKGFAVADLARLAGMSKNSLDNYLHRGKNARPDQVRKAGLNLIRTGRLMQRIGVALVRSSKRKPPTS